MRPLKPQIKKLPTLAEVKDMMDKEYEDFMKNIYPKIVKKNSEAKENE